jgi:flagellar hook assembly protein FlgD
VRFRCDLAQSARADLEIMDVRGRSVKKAWGGILPAGSTVLTWDGRAENGLMAAPGTYFARLTTPLGVSTQVLVWLR